MGRKVGTPPKRSRVAGLLHDQAVAFHPERLFDPRLAIPGTLESFSVLFVMVAKQQRQIGHARAFPDHRKDDAIRRHIFLDLQAGDRDTVIVSIE
jgi:hypothetical protein